MTSVLIGIPTLNGPSRLDRVLKSIKESTDLTNVRVLVSDDCSTEENLKLNKDALHHIPGTEMLMTDRRLGIAAQWNRLVRHAYAEIVVLLNDDVEVVPDWLDVLVFSLERNPDVGMVSLRSETGVVKSEVPKRPLIDYHESRLLYGSRGGTLVSSGGACFAFRRADWERVGGFDERFFCFYEEIDFGVSLAKTLGLVSCIASHPIIFHMGGATIAANSDASAVLTESRAKFKEKWGQTMDQLREAFGARPPKTFVEWHSQWKNWRLP